MNEAAAPGEAGTRPSVRPPAAAQEAMRKVLDRLRWQIQCSPLTQRTLERQLSFSKGYLSQVLRGHVDLKINHLLALLEALGVDPRDFFAEAGEESLERSGEPREGRSGEPRDGERSGVEGAAPGAESAAGRARFFAELESLDELRQRLARCERLLGAAAPAGAPR